MTNEAELTPDQIDELVTKLRLLEVEVARALDDSAASVRPVELDQAAIGRVSRMDAIQQQSMAKANRQALLIRADRIKAALDAAARDEYGFCRKCEEPIGVRRLTAQPEAPFCLSCQEALHQR